MTHFAYLTGQGFLNISPQQAELTSNAAHLVWTYLCGRQHAQAQAQRGTHHKEPHIGP